MQYYQIIGFVITFAAGFAACGLIVLMNYQKLSYKDISVRLEGLEADNTQALLTIASEKAKQAADNKALYQMCSSSAQADSEIRSRIRNVEKLLLTQENSNYWFYPSSIVNDERMRQLFNLLKHKDETKQTGIN
jgi:hypothetical protein